MVFRLVNYIRETRQEMKHVNWPTFPQIIKSTLLVIVLSLVVAAYLGGFDYLYQFLLRTFIF